MNEKSNVNSAKTSDFIQVLQDILVAVLELATEKKRVLRWLVRVNHPGEEVEVVVVPIHMRQAEPKPYYDIYYYVRV